MIDREAIWTAVFARVSALADFQETSRKVRSWDDCENFPVLFLSQGSETTVKTGRGLPNIYTMSGEIYLYVRNKSNDTPATEINALLGKIDDAFPPSGQVTFDGLVEDCWIEGQIQRDEGVLGDIGVAIVPIKVLVHR